MDVHERKPQLGQVLHQPFMPITNTAVDQYAFTRYTFYQVERAIPGCCKFAATHHVHPVRDPLRWHNIGIYYMNILFLHEILRFGLTMFHDIIYPLRSSSQDRA